MNPTQGGAAQAQQGGGQQQGQMPYPYPGNQVAPGVQQGQSGQIGQQGPNRTGQPQGIVSPTQQAASLQSVLQGIGSFLAKIGHPLAQQFNGLHGFGPQGTPAMNGIQQGGNQAASTAQAVQNVTQPTGSQGGNLGAGAGSIVQNAI